MTDKFEWPNWDYWMWDQLSDGRSLSIYHERTFDDGDIRSNKFDTDHKKWCREYFWNVEEAACLSFLRDPNKFKANNRWLVEDEPDYEEHSQLLTHLSRLHERIEDAQKKNHLSPEFFSPAMYVAWAKRVGVDVPDCIRIELERVERERAPPGTTLARPLDDMVTDTDDELPDEKVSSQDSRFRNNARKVILALLLLSGQVSKDTVRLSKALKSELDDQAREKADGEISVGWQTIKKRLDEARDLLK